VQPREEAQRGRGARAERREDLGNPHLREDEERKRLRVGALVSCRPRQLPSGAARGAFKSQSLVCGAARAEGAARRGEGLAGYSRRVARARIPRFRGARGKRAGRGPGR
jgi:hypothetical protein